MSKSVYIFLASILILLIIEFGVQPAAWAFKPSIHSAITTEAISSNQHRLGDRTFAFSERAVREINFSNEHTDDPAFQTKPSYHFDNEEFSSGSSRLVNLKEQIITKITSDNAPLGSARSDLGGALHTLQDFYAHSNWIELGNNDINSKLGRELFTGATKSDRTCPTDPAILGDAGLSQLTSGYFLFNKGLCGVPTGKCRHGVKLLGCSSGLNKDDPSRSGFSMARTLAVKASEDFIQQILDDSRVANNLKAVKGLMDID